MFCTPPNSPENEIQKTANKEQDELDKSINITLKNIGIRRILRFSNKRVTERYMYYIMYIIIT